MEIVKNEKLLDSLDYTHYLLEQRNNENRCAEKFSNALIAGRIAQMSLHNWISLSA